MFVFKLLKILDLHLTVSLFHFAAPFSLVSNFRNDGIHFKRVGHGGDWRFGTVGLGGSVLENDDD